MLSARERLSRWACFDHLLRDFSSRLLLRRSWYLFLPSSISLGNDQQPAIRTLPQTLGCYPRIVLQCRVNNAAVGGAQGIDGYGLPLTLRLFPQTQRHIFQRLAATLAIIFNIHDDVWTLGSASLTGDTADQILQCLEGLSLAPDQ